MQHALGRLLAQHARACGTTSGLAPERADNVYATFTGSYPQLGGFGNHHHMPLPSPIAQTSNAIGAPHPSSCTRTSCTRAGPSIALHRHNKSSPATIQARAMPPNAQGIAQCTVTLKHADPGLSSTCQQLMLLRNIDMKIADAAAAAAARQQPSWMLSPELM
jgi:hypothetical protein